MRMPAWRWGNSPVSAVPKCPHRLISSAKSWLCNTMVDRNKPILPWEAPPDVERLSPVAASAAILRHIRDAWNFTVARNENGPDPSLRMEYQDIYLTVPASFDAVARELTVQAARSAGLENVTLLEEPQAAFYAWIDAVGDRWREQVQKGDLVLVCDVGGGTSDFSLIRVSEADGQLELERIAVGDHLLVGRRQHGPGPGLCRGPAVWPKKAPAWTPGRCAACGTPAARPRNAC